MTKLVWDKTNLRRYETGVSNAVLYVKSLSGSNIGKYTTGVAWNGLTGVTESPSGAEETALYANNAKYLSLYSAENFGGTIKAYTYPDQWELCDGNYAGARTKDANYKYSFPGVRVAQQPRAGFGLSYRTNIGNDSLGDQYGFKLHIIWNAMATPSSKDYQTINDSPEAIEFSWDYTTVPTPFTASYHSKFKPTSNIVIDSRKCNQKRLNALMNVLYGTNTTYQTNEDGTYKLDNEGHKITKKEGKKPSLPSPDGVLNYMQVKTALS